MGDIWLVGEERKDEKMRRIGKRQKRRKQEMIKININNVVLCGES